MRQPILRTVAFVVKDREPKEVVSGKVYIKFENLFWHLPGLIKIYKKSCCENRCNS